jgi:hypothetical protein
MPLTTFVATSPFTGQEHTRRSERAYTHAVICHRPVAAVAAECGQDAEKDTARAAEYQLIAGLLEREETPSPDSPLMAPSRSRSWNSEQAGVRTRWDEVLYDFVDGPFSDGPYKSHVLRTRAELVAAYRDYAANAQGMSTLRRRRAEEARATNGFRESASFHHSEALAQKAAAKSPEVLEDRAVIAATARPAQALQG